MHTTANQKNRKTGEFRLNPVTYIKAGTEYPVRAWGGTRPGAGRPRVVK